MEIKILTIKEEILGANDRKAAENREMLTHRGILTINIMSSPGAGKTSLILRTIAALNGKLRIGVIEGDVASSVDAEKVHKQGAPVVQINIPGGCHLDAAMIEKALDNLPLADIDLLFIENVGNLICPAEFDLGEHRKVVLASTPEGDDKPYKYPLMFTGADVVVVTKIDLSPHLDFRMTGFREAVTALNPDVKILPVSAKTGKDLERWFSWLLNEARSLKKRRPNM